MIRYYGDLNARQIDVLREVGNIGAGNAATSLSVLLGESVSLSAPHVMIGDYDSVLKEIGDPEDLAVAALIHFSGDIRGIVLFLIDFGDAKAITQMLVGQEDGDEDDEGAGLSEMKISSVKELGNILGSSYLGSVSTLTGLSCGLSVPYAAVDMVSALLTAPMAEFSVDDTKILFVEESFLMREKSLRSHVILFADIPSLNKIMEKLGFDG
jgi:chemotaxis protein CheC